MHLYEEVRGYAAPLKLDLERVSMESVWRQAWGTLDLARKGRNVSLREEIAGVDLFYTADSFRLQQVFRNVFENALAACKDPVEITIACLSTSLYGKPALRIAVGDNGPGMNAEQQQRIFEPFFTTKTKGTGLGMAIAKRIIEAHGGKIAVGASSVGGAEITFTLPREGP
jgi:signal transduction histidine kinase